MTKGNRYVQKDHLKVIYMVSKHCSVLTIFMDAAALQQIRPEGLGGQHCLLTGEAEALRGLGVSFSPELPLGNFLVSAYKARPLP